MPAGHTYASLMSLYAQLRQKTIRFIILARLRAGSSCTLTCNYDTPPNNIRVALHRRNFNPITTVHYTRATFLSETIYEDLG